MLKFALQYELTSVDLLVSCEVGLGGEGSTAHLAVVLGLVGVQPLHVGFQRGQVAELLGAVAAPERLRVRDRADGRNCGGEKKRDVKNYISGESGGGGVL